MLRLVFLLRFLGQSWDQRWCEGNGLLERRKGKTQLCSPTRGWEEEEGAVMVVGAVLTGPGCGESPWGWCVYVCGKMEQEWSWDLLCHLPLPCVALEEKESTYFHLISSFLCLAKSRKAATSALFWFLRHFAFSPSVFFLHRTLLLDYL